MKKVTFKIKATVLNVFKRHAKEAGKPYNELLRLLVRHFNRAEAEKTNF